MNEVIFSGELAETLKYMADMYIENHTHVEGLIPNLPKVDDKDVTITESTITFRGDTYTLITEGRMKMPTYVKKYVKGKPITYRFNKKTVSYDAFERIGGKLSTVPVAKGSKYKLYELFTTDRFEQVAALQQEVDQRSECDSYGPDSAFYDDFGPMPDDFGIDIDMDFDMNY
jgi:hypothetical protein